MRTLTFAVGLAAGYVLGTRAGREKYEQIVEGARNLSNQPAVTQAQTKIKEMAAAGTSAVTSKINGHDSTDKLAVSGVTDSPSTF